MSQPEKKKLIAEGKIKKDKNESYIFKGDDNCYYEKIGKNEPVKLEDLPFDIPDNWSWIRQKNICWLDNGKKSKGEKLPYLEAKVIRGLKEPSIKTSGIIVDDSYRVILVDGENSGEIMTPPFRGYIGSTFKIFSATNKFNYELLLNIFLFNKDKYKNSKVGAAIPHLNKELFKESLIAVPPLEEQQRIVDKINSFEPLLQEYDSYEKKLTELESTFTEKLKKSILQEKKKLIAEGKIKKDKNESYIFKGDDNCYYEKIGGLVNSVPTTSKEIKSREILNKGIYPVISQSQKEIDGYYNDESRLILDLPIILFGDHTKVVKYIDQPFIPGADGTKLYTSRYFPKYVYYLMLYASKMIDDKGYARHNALLKNYKVPFFEDINTQIVIAISLDNIFRIINNIGKNKLSQI